MVVLFSLLFLGFQIGQFIGVSFCQLDPLTGRIGPPAGMKNPHSNKPPTSFPGAPESQDTGSPDSTDKSKTDDAIHLGDPLAARARKMKKKREKEG